MKALWKARARTSRVGRSIRCARQSANVTAAIIGICFICVSSIQSANVIGTRMRNCTGLPPTLPGSKRTFHGAQGGIVEGGVVRLLDFRVLHASVLLDDEQDMDRALDFSFSAPGGYCGAAGRRAAPDPAQPAKDFVARLHAGPIRATESFTAKSPPAPSPIPRLRASPAARGPAGPRSRPVRAAAPPRGRLRLLLLGSRRGRAPRPCRRRKVVRGLLLADVLRTGNPGEAQRSARHPGQRGARGQELAEKPVSGPLGEAEPRHDAEASLRVASSPSPRPASPRRSPAPAGGHVLVGLDDDGQLLLGMRLTTVWTPPTPISCPPYTTAPFR